MFRLRETGRRGAAARFSRRLHLRPRRVEFTGFTNYELYLGRSRVEQVCTGVRRQTTCCWVILVAHFWWPTFHGKCPMGMTEIMQLKYFRVSKLSSKKANNADSPLNRLN